MVKPLVVYKASAGSGKTFTLATEYIKLLVQNPQSYRTILAVTFTNKATEEMKMRIISQLYGISRQLPDSNNYLANIVSKTGLSEAQVCKRAGEALHLLLHNYNYFRVETIDTFFQSVLRNLARELDLTANLRIGLNDIQVEEQAVDRLIDNLTHTDVMLQWILKYIMENISDNQSWNIIGKVKQFGRTIFRDYYKEQSETLQTKMHDEHFFEAYTKQMRAIRQDALERMKEIGNEFFDALSAEGLAIEDLSNGRTGVAGFFLKLQAGVFDEGIVGKRVADCADDVSKWCTKTHPRRDAIMMSADTVLQPMLRRAIEERPRQWRLYKSADLTLRHLNQLRLLGSIEQKVRQLNDESNRFLLSDTQQLLHSLIQDSDSPFIFEKIGARLEHVMIDEFQDTSTVQWQNFKVLLEECMSHVDTENLIVGDVKQSIYRWRSGDWRLLNAIDREFSYSQQQLEIRNLTTNYRSTRGVIEFNNAFFVEAARQEYEAQCEEYPDGAEQLRHAYADVEQQVPDDKPSQGLVSIRLLHRNDYQQQVLVELTDTVRMLMDKGVTPRQIAILVRSNRMIPAIADYFALQLPEVRIVSDEAFRLDSSAACTLIVQALHLLTHPDDMLAQATIVKLYHRAVLHEQLTDDQLFQQNTPLSTLLPETFSLHTEELLQMSLYELAERLFTIFQLQTLTDESGYVCAFFDQLSQFCQDNTTDIDSFIREWDETIGAKTIQSTETDGIRILTIHKSKGLEFDNVIIPYADWRLEMPDFLWCQPQEEPFSALPLVPVDYSEKQMRGTVYEHDYLDEHLQNTVDNLNLLYVAFTRASHNLFVIGRRAAKNTRALLIETVLPALHLDGVQLDGVDNEETAISFQYGTLSHCNATLRPKVGERPSNIEHHTSEIACHTQTFRSENVFLQPVHPIQVSIETFTSPTEFRQSNRSRDFVEGEDETNELSYIKMGSVLHEVFSRIRTTADISQALSQLQSEGILYDDELSRDKITSLLRKRLESERIASWFSPRWQLFNECSILRLDNDGNLVERRPDRVMTDGSETHVVDFKFGKPHPEYIAQIQEYMQLLSEMGMPQVHGWLWYVYTNKIEEVKL